MFSAGHKTVSLYVKIILVIFALAYFISPVDIIPDILLPYIGWLDDGVVLATVLYMLRYGRLPDFIFRNKGPFKFFRHKPSSFKEASYQRRKTESRTRADATGTASNKKKTPPRHKTPYEILGIKQGAGKREIQTAYKAAIKKYHPDKLSHLGEEFSTLANEKFLEIQKAYDTLIKKFK